ncbi:MAG: DUF4190 domain-containing protein [Phycisphaerales bacterium]|nr:DUF4190 domain-containing protein [Planctomycetota bacterium]MCH8508092.1 DUF4190 domain-containing protein [Phycisphaerales bacterium]
MRDMAYEPPGGDGLGYGNLPETERTSLAAILGFLLSLGGCVFGITAVLGLPLCIFALLTIGRSHGRVGGRGLAIAGLILALFNLAAWGSCLGGGIGMVNMVESRMVVPTEQVFVSLEADDLDGARDALVSPGSGVSDAELIAFREAYQSTLGAFVDRPRGVRSYFNSMSEWGPWSSVLSSPGQNVVPVLFTFERGDALVLIYPDEATGRPRSIALYDTDLNEYTLPMQPGWESTDSPAGDPADGPDATADDPDAP